MSSIKLRGQEWRFEFANQAFTEYGSFAIHKHGGYGMSIGGVNHAWSAAQKALTEGEQRIDKSFELILSCVNVANLSLHACDLPT